MESEINMEKEFSWLVSDSTIEQLHALGNPRFTWKTTFHKGDTIVVHNSSQYGQVSITHERSLRQDWL